MGGGKGWLCGLFIGSEFVILGSERFPIFVGSMV